jgi:hypothetical protein
MRGLLWSLAIAGTIFVGGAFLTGSFAGAMTVVVSVLVISIVGCLIT